MTQMNEQHRILALDAAMVACEGLKLEGIASLQNEVNARVEKSFGDISFDFFLRCQEEAVSLLGENPQVFGADPEYPYVNKALKSMIALSLSAAIGEPSCYRADWENEDSVVPDMVIGNHNDWWLKTSERDGTLYVQSRHSTTDGGYYAEVVNKMVRIVRDIKELTGVTIALPPTKKDS